MGKSPSTIPIQTIRWFLTYSSEIQNSSIPLSPEEYDIFMDAAQQATQLELDEWEEAAAEATDYAKNTQKVEFIEVDIEKFRDKVIGVQQEMIDNNPKITEMYEHIQKVNEEYENKEDAE